MYQFIMIDYLIAAITFIWNLSDPFLLDNVSQVGKDGYRTVCLHCGNEENVLRDRVQLQLTPKVL